MVNCGSQPYTANGYPTLQVLDADRKHLDVTVAQGTTRISRITGFDGPPQPVTAGGGEVAVDKGVAVVSPACPSLAPKAVAEGAPTAGAQSVDEYLGQLPAGGRPARMAVAEAQRHLGHPGATQGAA